MDCIERDTRHLRSLMVTLNLSTTIDATPLLIYIYSNVTVNLQPQQGAKTMRKRVLTQDLVVLYTVKHLTMEEIGRLVGMTRQGVMKRLHKAGITRQDGESVMCVCAYCGKETIKLRSYVRGTAQSYCCAEHYYASRENPDYHQWRQGGRLARAIVAQHYLLTRDEVVHHIDGNQRHNDLNNLEVYASQADHLAVHHGRQIEPVWSGRRHAVDNS